MVDANKHILELFQCSFGVEVVACNHCEFGNRFNELKLVRMSFYKMGKCWKSDIHHDLILSTGLLFHMDHVVYCLAYVRNVRNYGELFIYQIQTLFLAFNVIQKSNNQFPWIVMKHTL